MKPSASVPTSCATGRDPDVQPMVRMQGICKRFNGGVQANVDVDFDIRSGEIHALLGENGAGKSTLMHILYGMTPRDAGDVWMDGQPVRLCSVRDALRHGIGMVHQEFMLVEPFTILENLILGQNRLQLTEARERIDSLCREFGLRLNVDDRIENLSIGARQRVEILKLLFRGARVLILDEPTAVLTPSEVKALFSILRRLVAQGKAVMIVTHKLHEIMALVDRVTIMRSGKVSASGIAVADADEPQLARLMVGRDVRLKVTPEVQPPGASVLEVRQLHVVDDTGWPAVQGVDFSVHAGEVLAIAGVDGNGQSQLAQALMGLLPVAGGSIQLDGTDVGKHTPAQRRGAGMGYMPADRRGVAGVMEFSVEKNSILGNLSSFTRAGFWLGHSRIREQAQHLIQRFQVRTPSVEYPAGKLSGGNLQKLLMGRELAQSPRFLLLEQPTRGLDVGAIEGIWAEILKQRKSGAAILLVSSELEEIFNLADRIAVLYGGRLMGVVSRQDATLELVGRMMGGESFLPQVPLAVPAR